VRKISVPAAKVLKYFSQLAPSLCNSLQFKFLIVYNKYLNNNKKETSINKKTAYDETLRLEELYMGIALLQIMKKNQPSKSQTNF
jgi:hypothetical protein